MINFKGSFRMLTDDVDVNIRHADTCPLILIKQNGVAVYGNRPSEKDEIIELFDETKDLLLWPWVGKWKTDVFRLDKHSIDKHYNPASND